MPFFRTLFRVYFGLRRDNPHTAARASERWTDLANMPLGYASWSRDGQYLYFDTTLTDDPTFFRICISDRKLERLVSLKRVRRFWGELGEWTGLAPDDSPLLVRDTSSQEVMLSTGRRPN